MQMIYDIVDDIYYITVASHDFAVTSYIAGTLLLSYISAATSRRPACLRGLMVSRLASQADVQANVRLKYLIVIEDEDQMEVN